MLGSFYRLFARVLQQFGFGTQKIQANDDYCHVWRRAECTSLGPGIKHPSLRWLTLVWPPRDVQKRFTWYFFRPSVRAQHDDLCCYYCVYSRITRSHERRALGALLFLVSGSEPESIDS